MTLQKAATNGRNQAFAIPDQAVRPGDESAALLYTDPRSGATWLLARDEDAQVRVSISPEDLWHLREYLNSAEIPESAFKEPKSKADPWQDGDSISVEAPSGEGGWVMSYVRVDGQWRAYGQDCSHLWRAVDEEIDNLLDDLGGVVYTAQIRGGKPVS